MFHPAIYRASGDARQNRWAVFCTVTHVFYFPSRYGRDAAVKLAARLSREPTPESDRRTLFDRRAR